MLNGGQQVDLQGKRPESEALVVLPPKGGLRSRQILSDIYLSLLFKSQLFFTSSPQLRIDSPHTNQKRKKPHLVGQMCASVLAVAKCSPVLLSP